MDIPNKNHPAWAAVIKKDKHCSFEFLATKIIVSRLNSRYDFAPTPETLAATSEELVAFFEKNKHIPAAQNDLAKIINGEVTT